MHLKFIRRLALINAALFSGALVAAELPEKYQYIQEAFPEVDVTSVVPSPIDGLLQMSVGADFYYISEDGKYFISGDIYGLQSRENLTAAARTAARANYLNTLGDDAGVTFVADDEKYVVTIFTDIDCPYCRESRMRLRGRP